MKEIIKDLKELTQHFTLPLWLVTVLLWILVVGLVILSNLIDSM
jgi:predicted Zn-dependent protease